jgi:hypothetical protein
MPYLVNLLLSLFLKGFRFGLFQFLMNKLVIKFVFFVAFAGIVTALLPLVVDLIPGLDGIRNALSNTFPSSVLYFLHFAELQFGLGVVMSAYAVRFLIRRIPFIG